jgi:hypothetical protein
VGESQAREDSAVQGRGAANNRAAETSEVRLPSAVVPAQATCPTCSAAQTVSSPQWVHAIGHIELRYPTLSVEKEVAQAKGRTNTAGLTDQEAFLKVLQDNSYLVRQMCAVLLVQGMETYLLVPRNPVDYTLLVQAVRSSPSPADLDVVIGVKGPIADPNVCNGLQVPIVIFDQIYSFDSPSLLQALPLPENIAAERFTASAREMFNRIMGQSDNAGATDEHRALNYLAVRYPPIYTRAAIAHATDSSLTAVSVKPSPMSGTRNIRDVIFAYTDRNTDVVEKYFVRVDVTEEFPFLVTALSPYYDR